MKESVQQVCLGSRKREGLSMKQRWGFWALVALGIAAAGCEASKSSDILSPTVAGPIPGISITAPRALDPQAGSRVAVDQQPITLLIENATTNSPRPLNYLFEIATDAGFTNKVFTREGVAPGDGGRTSLRLPDALASGRTYYWRARAQDGANTGPYSGAVPFTVFTPVFIDRPILVAPINNAVVSNSPTFVIGNAARSGPAGPVSYTIEISDTSSFAARSIWTVLEQSGQTQLVSPAGLSGGIQYFWHARARDSFGNEGPWSDVQSFRTDGAPPSGGGGGPVGPWENCGSTPGVTIVECVHAAVNPPHTVEGAFEVTKRVAWLLRGGGAGLLIKDGGENVVTWNGRNFAAARIVYPDGHLYKLLTDVPATNGPSWQDEGVDTALIPRWFAPMQP
jgi:hypothetical protein